MDLGVAIPPLGKLPEVGLHGVPLSPGQRLDGKQRAEVETAPGLLRQCGKVDRVETMPVGGGGGIAGVTVTGQSRGHRQGSGHGTSEKLAVGELPPPLSHPVDRPDQRVHALAGVLTSTRIHHPIRSQATEISIQ